MRVMSVLVMTAALVSQNIHAKEKTVNVDLLCSVDLSDSSSLQVGIEFNKRKNSRKVYVVENHFKPSGTVSTLVYSAPVFSNVLNRVVRYAEPNGNSSNGLTLDVNYRHRRGIVASLNIIVVGSKLYSEPGMDCITNNMISFSE